MRIGVTGPNGYIGSSFIKHVRKNYRGHMVIPHDMRLTHSLETAHPNMHIMRLMERCDTVLHTAGKNRASDYNILQNNIESTLNVLLEALSMRKKVVITGSDHSIGAYGASKKIIEKMVNQFHKLGVPCIYVAIPNVYGPGCKPNYNSFVTTLCWHRAKGEPYDHLVNDRNSGISLVHISDLNEILYKLCIKNRYALAEEEPYAFEIPRYSIYGACVLSAKLGDVIDIIEGRIPEFPISKHHIENIQNTVEWYRQNEKTC
jgi:UDP-2-acetamido-2,6-beta-L-arabino-hexul-4-ose reductase